MLCFEQRERGAPVPEVLQYQVDAWSGRSKPLFQLQVPKINLIYGPRVGDVSDIKLIRTDTTLDLSQKAEKRCPRSVRPRSQLSRHDALHGGFTAKAASDYKYKKTTRRPPHICQTIFIQNNKTRIFIIWSCFALTPRAPLTMQTI